MRHEVPTVFIVDDDESARKSLAFTLDAAGYPTSSFSSASNFLDYYAPYMRGCVVLDYQMPDVNGLQLQERLAAREIILPIIFVSGNASIPVATRAIRSGADEFLEKPVDRQQLLRLVQQAIERDSAIENTKSTFKQRIAGLTNREREVMRLIIDGKSTKQIASHFGTSVQTAAKHRSRILTKMHVENDVLLAHLVHSAKNFLTI